jgi:hypothetical protein
MTSEGNKLTVKVLHEAGYEQALFGLSLSYNSEPEKMKSTALKLAHRVQGDNWPGGENKFLEAIFLWLDVDAPRFWWQEADTYRLSTKQSESSMHTILKRCLTQEDFVEPIEPTWLNFINRMIEAKDFRWLKRHLPESFLQRRVWVMSYKTLQNIWYQRRNHKLPEWHYFLDQLLPQLQHPELVSKSEESNPA